MLPQLFLLQRTGEVENLTSHYIFTLGGYRAFYLLNWIYRYVTKDFGAAAVAARGGGRIGLSGGETNTNFSTLQSVNRAWL